VPCSEDPRILRIELSDIPFLTLNQRTHRLDRSEKTRKIRAEACKAAKAQPFFPFGKVRVRVIFHPPDKRRRDFISGNWIPTIKAALDGLTDAKVWRDDNDLVIREMSLVDGSISPDKKARLVIQVIEDAGT
jgi:Holliday junction resolvase RusA-like endonuclease